MAYAGNPNMQAIGKLPSPPKTEVGKFYRDLAKFSREKVPKELLSLFDFVNKLDTKKTNYLTEISNMYEVLKSSMLPTLYDKLVHGETPTKRELDALRLLKDMMAESHKLKYGDRKVIESVVSVADIRHHMMKKAKIIDAEVVSSGNVSQDLDRSGRSEGGTESETAEKPKDEKDSSNNGSSSGT